MRDDLGARMKDQYESRTRYMLPRRTYTLIRVDGKAFHTFTRHCTRPYDEHMSRSMVAAAKALCEEVQGAKLGYVQSDEISVLTTDFAAENTQAWFDGNIQKIASIAASCATAAFNREWWRNTMLDSHSKMGLFDARVWTIPDRVEVANYFIWRQKDASRNSLSMLAQSHFSHKELLGKSQSEMHEMLHAKGINWDDCIIPQKRGVAIIDTEDGWIEDREIPIWTKNRNHLIKMIPQAWEEEEHKCDQVD